jgi:hypothetical protein
MKAPPPAPAPAPSPAPARAYLPRRGWAQVVATLLALGAAPASAELLFVPSDFPTIQQAIDAAELGDTVVVEPGLYTENIVLRSGVDVRGEEAALTLLRAADLDDYIVWIEDVDDVLFANFTLLDSNWGVGVVASGDIIISNTIFDTLDEIAVDTDPVSIVDVMHNVFFDNVTAVRRGSPETWIFNNIFSHNIQTLVSGGFGDLHSNVTFNCFFANDDLATPGADTALGTDFQIGDPQFVDIERGDFHLRLDSPCIDAGTGTDVIDDSSADIGAYGGPFADPWPFPVPEPELEDTSGPSGPPFSLRVGWEPNLDYRVTNPANPGSYRVYYSLNEPGPPYDGNDAEQGTAASPIDVGDVTSFELTGLMPAVEAPAAPELLLAEPRNQAVQLEWSAVTGAVGYRLYFEAEGEEEAATDVGDATMFTLTGLENGVEHVFSVVALARPAYFVAVTVLDNTPDRNESVFSEEASVQVGEEVESARSNARSTTPDEVLPEPDLPDDNGCFIATAAFSGADAPAVRVLRDFRDRYLATNALGRRLVASYYAVSPSIARYLEAHPELKPTVRAALLPIVALAMFLLESSAATKVSVLGLLLLLTVSVRRRGAEARRNAGGARP